MKVPALALVLVIFTAGGAQDSIADIAKRLKDKDVGTRLVAVDELAREADPKAEKALHGSLADGDWEVVERAAIALGENGTTISLDPLVKLALDAPVARIRRAAARSLGRISAAEAANRLQRKLTGPDSLAAAQALATAVAARADDTPIQLKPAEKAAWQGKDNAVQAAAARALVTASRDERAQVLEKSLAVKSVQVRCAALDACAGDASEALDPVLLAILADPELSDLVERRALAHLRAALVSRADAAGGAEAASKLLEVVKPLLESKEGLVAARGARLIGDLGQGAKDPARLALGADESPSTGGTARAGEKPAANAPPAPKLRFDPAALLAALRPAIAHESEAARASAARALARIGGAEATKLAFELGRGDQSARVRFQGIGAVFLLRGIEEDSIAFFVQRLATDAEANVRMEAAVKLGQKGNTAAVEPLVAALADPAWEVAACAAVSLGKTQGSPAVDPLASLATQGKDWKLRAAAIAGLSNLYQKAAVEKVIPALADPDPFVVRTAHAYLVGIAREELPAKVEAWTAWWEANRGQVLLVDPETQAEMRRRFSSAQTVPAQVYKDLDIVVLESRGDSIEVLLGKQEIEHRMTMAGKVAESGLHPDALFVANCTGEIEAGDVERLRWFVLTGGRLFGSCWALSETIEKAVPGVLAKFETRDEVLDHVPAEDVSALAGGSPYTEGVFDKETRPIYALEGAHLIRVVDPERAEVLLDSPACADKWGAGDLAAWFEAGHGVVLDSVNHFDAQGLELAPGLKSRQDRQAYAIDHMGLSYSDLRAIAGEKYWENSLRASEKVLDLSVFRLVTNFVRLWRREKGR
ncbi:MAG: HEAT repeat domain-containing protein [Planctomycetota bacterium]